MSFNKNTTDNNSNTFENDDMNIKSQLNTSLELKGISVSEELINRTLEAVKSQEAGLQEESVKQHVPTDKKAGKKLLWFKYARILAGAAAAIFVVAVGLNTIGGLSKSEKDMSTSLRTQEMTAGSSSDAVAIATPAVGEGNVDASSDPALSKATQPTQNVAASDMQDAQKDTAAGTKEEEKSSAASIEFADEDTDDSGKKNVDTNTDSENGTKNTDNTKNSDSTGNTNDTADKETRENNAVLGISAAIADNTNIEDSKTEGKAVGAGLNGGTNINPSVTVVPNQCNGTSNLTFRSIFFDSPEKVEGIKIINETDKTSITLIKKEDIENFYSIMDQYQYTGGTQTATALNYTIEASGPQSQEAYTIGVGDNISIYYRLGDICTDNYYCTTDIAKLITDLGVLFLKYSQTN